MILGLGTDIVEISRIESAWLRHGPAFAKRILSINEWEHAQNFPKGRMVEFVAGRFAAKEAIAKALGCGLGRLPMSTVSVVLLASGLHVQFLDKHRDEAYASDRWWISISHSRDTAMAVALWER